MDWEKVAFFPSTFILKDTSLTDKLPRYEYIHIPINNGGEQEEPHS